MNYGVEENNVFRYNMKYKLLRIIYIMYFYVDFFA